MAVAASDFNGEGKIDLAVSAYNSTTLRAGDRLLLGYVAGPRGVRRT
jgi:hypothetical protein